MPIRRRCVESYIRQTLSRACTCSCARSSRTAATSRATKPPANCCIWPCATSKRIGRCRLSLGGKQLISSPFCSASDSPPPSTETFNRPQHTKFLTRPANRSLLRRLCRRSRPNCSSSSVSANIAEAINATSVAFKNALIERALRAELSHHLGYPPGAAKSAR
ncbi:transposase fragment [Burkholderia thailandensis E264]|uniref:Transposase n=1 Tax=Burkholderia thailandensis (strain ATCC 700388 / DSM 13276 / CCUG 48851 / CIP 106301 / E264) TaxID=271848 RepID=Q2T8M7_BURTA|nr:transposase fragment [Burkholderia thailandensis E264]